MTPAEQIKEKLNIVDFIRQYVELKPAGRNFKANCPFHKEKTPSFIVSPDRQTWHCFGSCAEGGDIFKFLMKYENIEFYEALKILAEKAGVELKKISPVDQKQFGVLYDINESAKDIFKKEMERGRRAKEYLKERGINTEIVNEFEIGFAPQNLDELTVNLINLGYDVKDIERAGLNFKSDKGGYIDRFRGRVMFPIYNSFGKVVGFSGRILPEFDNGETGKYINSPETPIFNKSRTLYGFHKSKNYIHEKKSAVLVEGQMDFLMSYQDGVKNAVATSGTALTEDHLRLLKRQTDELILLFDNDEAGLKAAERGIDMANNLDFNVRVLILKDYKDPAEAVSKKPGELENMIKKAEPATEFYFNRYISEDLQKSPAELKKGIRAVLIKLKNILSPVERAHWLKKLSYKTGIDEKSLGEEMDQLKTQQPVAQKTDEQPINGNKPELTRLELVAERILNIVMANESLIPKIKEYFSFLPESYQCAYKYIADGEKYDDPDINNLINKISFSSSLDVGDDEIAKETELNKLLENLKTEFFKDKQNDISKAIKIAERKKDDAALAQALKEFDEVSKMLQNGK